MTLRSPRLTSGCTVPSTIFGGNRELAAEAERIHRRIQAARVRASVPGRLCTAQDQHAEIVEALRKRDPVLAQEAVRRHITSAKENVLGFLKSRAAASGDRPEAIVGRGRDAGTSRCEERLDIMQKVFARPS